MVFRRPPRARLGSASGFASSVFGGHSGCRSHIRLPCPRWISGRGATRNAWSPQSVGVALGLRAPRPRRIPPSNRSAIEPNVVAWMMPRTRRRFGVPPPSRLLRSRAGSESGERPHGWRSRQTATASNEAFVPVRGPSTRLLGQRRQRRAIEGHWLHRTNPAVSTLGRDFLWPLRESGRLRRVRAAALTRRGACRAVSGPWHCFHIR